MSFAALLFVALATAFGVTYLITYAPMASLMGKAIWSPRLVVCKLLAPFDIGVTFWLTFGAMTGLTTVAMGISTIIYNILVGLGFSIAVIVVKKWFVPVWEKQYQVIKTRYETTGVFKK